MVSPTWRKVVFSHIIATVWDIRGPTRFCRGEKQKWVKLGDCDRFSRIHIRKHTQGETPLGLAINQERVEFDSHRWNSMQPNTTYTHSSKANCRFTFPTLLLEEANNLTVVVDAQFDWNREKFSLMSRATFQGRERWEFERVNSTREPTSVVVAISLIAKRSSESGIEYSCSGRGNSQSNCLFWW